MIGMKKTTLCLVFIVTVVLLATPAFAKLIDEITGLPYGTPYNDGEIVWYGTTPFISPQNTNLKGTVDWVVYADGDYQFSGDYAPTIGEFVYVYQMHNTGSVSIENYSVLMDNFGDNIGSFIDATHGVDGVLPDYPELEIEQYASWDFYEGIDPGQFSAGLVYSSPYTPQNQAAIALDGGAFAWVIPVPSPSPVPVPEPAMFLSLIIGLGMMLASRRFWRS